MALTRRLSLERRFLAKVADNTDPDACWEWTGGKDKFGYGKFNTGSGGRWTFAHRFAYTTYVGPIPDKYHVHHECDNPGCVNSRHLTALSPREHWKLGNAPTLENANKTHCDKGHPLTGDNLYEEPYKYGTKRKCKQCRHEVQMERKAKQKAAERKPKPSKEELTEMVVVKEMTYTAIALAYGVTDTRPFATGARAMGSTSHAY